LDKKTDIPRIDEITSAINDILKGRTPEPLDLARQKNDEIRQLSDFVNRLIQQHKLLTDSTFQLSGGELDRPVQSSLAPAHSLKNLQAALRHLAWQTAQIAKKEKSDPGLVTRHTIAENSDRDIRVLLAEDYPVNQQVVMAHLKMAGYQVDLAEDGQQAIEAFKEKPYHLILMDLEMPKIDGIEATKRIRELEAASGTGRRSENPPESIGSPVRNRVPIVAMTAHAFKGYEEACMKEGMDDYCAKPVKRKALLDMVEKWTN